MCQCGQEIDHPQHVEFSEKGVPWTYTDNSRVVKTGKLSKVCEESEKDSQLENE